MKTIDNKKINITDEEFDYYLELVKETSTDIFSGTDYFKDILEVDEDGLITMVKTPKRPIPWAVLFFCQQLMISQRLRMMDEFIRRNKK